MTSASKILLRLCRPHWYRIIELIKCSQGLSVGELAEALDMSYMGVKKHCLAMQKLGYLDTWRRPKDVGRPEKIYRLTTRLDPVFPGIGNDMCMAVLDAAEHLDPNAAEKLLFTVFRQMTDRLLTEVDGSCLERKAEKLAAIRNNEGRYSVCNSTEEGKLWIEEYHNPLEPLFEKYPTIERMELQMFERVLHAHVVRKVERNSGLTLYRFELSPR